METHEISSSASAASFAFTSEVMHRARTTIAASVVRTPEQPAEQSDRDVLGLPAPPASDPHAQRRAAALAEVICTGGLLEMIAAESSRATRSQIRAAECGQQARAAQAERHLAEQREAIERAREAAEDAGIWGIVADIAAVVAAAVGIAGAAFSGGGEPRTGGCRRRSAPRE